MAKDCNYSPITLSGIFKHDDTKSTATILPAAFRIDFRYNTDIGREIEFVIACGKYFSVNFILGKYFHKKAKAHLCFEKNMLHVPVFQSKNNESFNGSSLLFWRPVRWYPPFQSARAATGNISVCKEIIEIIVTFNPKSTFLPVEKSYYAEIVPTTIANMSPPTSLPLLHKSDRFEPYLNERFWPPSNQASTGSSTGFTLNCEGVSSSSNTASSSDATSGTGTNVQPSMFTGASFYNILTSK